MEQRPVISWRNKRWGLPIYQTVTLWLLMDRLQPSDIWWGVFYTAIVLIWITCLYNIITQKEVDIFAGKK